jgi:hypothetical protein
VRYLGIAVDEQVVIDIGSTAPTSARLQRPLSNDVDQRIVNAR